MAGGLLVPSPVQPGDHGDLHPAGKALLGLQSVPLPLVVHPVPLGGGLVAQVGGDLLVPPPVPTEVPPWQSLWPDRNWLIVVHTHFLNWTSPTWNRLVL